MRVTIHPDPPDDAALVERAGELAARLGLPLGDAGELVLVCQQRGLALRVRHSDDPILAQCKPLVNDWRAIDVASPMGRSLKQPLLKAVGVHKGDVYRPRIVDATAGLGEDAWLLACFGCRVTAIERHPVIFALLEDGLARMMPTHQQPASRLSIMHANAQAVLHQWAAAASADVDAGDDEDRPQVVYLDPMFPPGRKTAERKPLRILRQLAGDDTDSETLLALACRVAGRRVVVKRPRHAAPLAGNRAPSLTFAGKSVRYDVYLCEGETP